MAKKKESNTFHIFATVVIETSIEVNAETLEDALSKSRELTPTDFVTILGEHNDSSSKITGVYEQYKETKIA